MDHWHGFHVGIAGVAAPVPEPGSVGLLLAGLAMVALALRRKVHRAAFCFAGRHFTIP